MASKTNKKFIELPIYSIHVSPDTSFYQLINVDHIIRVYNSIDNHTILELINSVDLVESLNIALEYEEVVDIIKSC